MQKHVFGILVNKSSFPLYSSHTALSLQKGLSPAEVLARLKSEKQKVKKSSTVMSKTKRDWSSFTTKNKLTEDLKVATKSKDSYLERKDFLNRTQQVKDGLAKEARLKGMGKI